MARRLPREEAELEMNLTSFLDLVFNILSFFVMTFNPPLPERNFDINLPPPKLQQVQADGPGEMSADEPTPLDEIRIIIGATPNGQAGAVMIESTPVQGGLPRLGSVLSSMVGASRGAERLQGVSMQKSVAIVADPKLKFRYLVTAVDACYQVGIKSISFSEPPKP